MLKSAQSRRIEPQPWPSRAEAPPLRVLVVTRIFPNCKEPFDCAFQRQQLAALARLCQVEVLATIPSFAGASLLGDRTRAGRLAQVPRHDRIDGVAVTYARAVSVPGWPALRAIAPVNVPLCLAGLAPHVVGLRGRFDVVLGTFLHPEACAAAVVARWLGVPLAVKAHGTDVNVAGQWSSLQGIIGAALRSATWSFGVSRPLVDALVRLGAPEDRAVLLPNGVDRALFHPRDRGRSRRALGLPEEGRIVLYVGRLLPTKGLRELCAAFERVRAAPDGQGPVHLVIVGEGSLQAELAAWATRLNGAEAARCGGVYLAGARPLGEVAQYLGACDLLALPSWAEGTPNVVLEALASGRPVVATRVGGIPDLIEEGRTGVLVPPRDAGALAGALEGALARGWDEGVLVGAAPPSWEDSAALLHRHLAAALPRER